MTGTKKGANFRGKWYSLPPPPPPPLLHSDCKSETVFHPDSSYHSITNPPLALTKFTYHKSLGSVWYISQQYLNPPNPKNPTALKVAAIHLGYPASKTNAPAAAAQTIAPAGNTILEVNLHRHKMGGDNGSCMHFNRRRKLLYNIYSLDTR